MPTIHVQVERDTANPDINTALTAIISAPGVAAQREPITNGQSFDIALPGVHISAFPVSPTVRVFVEDFNPVPPGAPTAITFNLVFKIAEIFLIQIGLLPVHITLR